MGTSRFAVSKECAHNRGIDGQLGSFPEQRQAISDNLQPPSVGNVGLGDVEVTDNDVRRDSAACLSTDPSGHGLPITTTWMVSENQLMSMSIDQRSRFGFDECETCREHGA